MIKKILNKFFFTGVNPLGNAKLNRKARRLLKIH